MKNLFTFDYIESPLTNQDGSASNFRQVFGLDGKNMACPKGSYHIVKTEDLSSLGEAFIDKGYTVSTFNHRFGEVIGLSVGFGDKPTKVGACRYNLLITVPNNGGGKGYLSIKQERLICTNGMISNKTVHKDNYIKIPHTWNYKDSIKLMEQSIDGFTSLMEQLEQRDEFFASQPLKQSEVMFHLNKWFFEHEMPSSQKGDATLDDFRKGLAEDVAFKSKPRYNELKEAFNREVEYNSQLGLDLTMYTAYASVTNYLSRRVEASASKASNEVQIERTSQKLKYFDVLVK
jgi:hypothetical protein